MKIAVNDPPRAFLVKGAGLEAVLQDCAHVALDSDEQVTFTTPSGGEYDVTRKSWGFYATPSTNGRLKNFGLRTALVRALSGRFYVMLVENGHETDFQNYLQSDQQSLVCWLDDEAHLERLVAAFNG